jgi:hypothetical protein
VSAKIKVLALTDAQLEDLLMPDMVLEGGHYAIGEPIDSVIAWTWERAVELYARALAKGLTGVGLMVLIDDFAVELGQREQFRADYRLPDEYRRSLERWNVPESAVIIVWEVQLRNRARGDLRSRLKPRIVVEDDGYFVQCLDGTYRPATKGTIPVCNLIMARHIAFKDRAFKYALNLYDMKWECHSGGGVVMSRSLYDTDVIVYNVYITLDNKVGFVVVHDDH